MTVISNLLNLDESTLQAKEYIEFYMQADVNYIVIEDDGELNLLSEKKYKSNLKCYTRPDYLYFYILQI